MKTKYTISYKPLIGLIILISLLAGGFKYFDYKTNRSFEDIDELKKWLDGKHFTSTTKDFTQMDVNSNYSSPVGTLELKFEDGTMEYQACQPQTYEVYKDMGTWVVGFKKCGTGDLFELVIPSSGDCYVRSVDYDTDKMGEMSSSSGINKLNAIASKHTVNGPVMTY